MDRSMSSKARKSQGFAIEASETLSSLFSQQFDSGMLSSAAKHTTNEKGEKATEHHTSYNPINGINYNNTCIGVNPLPEIELTPAAATNDNESRKNGVGVIIESIPYKEKKKKFYSPLIKPAKFLLHPKRIRTHFRR